MIDRYSAKLWILIWVLGLGLLPLSAAARPHGDRALSPGGASASNEAGGTDKPTESTEEILTSAREMFVAKNYRLSELLYKSVLIREPNHITAMLELAVVYETTGRFQYARGLLSRASTIDPYDKEIMRRNAEIVRKMATALKTEVDSLLQHGAYDEALPKLSVLLTTQPENAELYYQRATCHLALGNMKEAISEINKAINLKADKRYRDLKNKTIWLAKKKEIRRLTARAKQHLRVGTWKAEQQALDVIGKILEIDPNDTWAAERYAAMKSVADAKESLKEYDVILARVWNDLKRFGKMAGVAFVTGGRFVGDNLGIVLLILLPLLLLNSPLTHVLSRHLARRLIPRGSLSGHLESFSIHEILALINTHGRTGALKLRMPSTKGSIFFKKGEVYHCSCENMVGRKALQHLLKSATEGAFAFKELASSRDETIDTPLSLILMELPARSENMTAQKILNNKKRSKMSALLRKP